MKKKATIGLVATLGLGLCAYALSQQAPVKEEKKNQNQVQYLQGDKKKSASSSNKQEESIETVNSKEKIQAEQIVVKITDEGFVTSHGDHFHYDNGKVPYDAIISDVPMQDVIKHTAYKGLDLVPATIQLAGAEIELVSLMNREGRLKNSLERVKHNYDYVIIDCPPSLGLLTINGLTAASSVMIPIQCEFYALEGVTMLMNTIQLVQRNLNPALKLEGVLMTMYDSRTNLSQDVVNEVQKYFKTKMYQTIIPRNVRLSEAPSHGQPVIDYDSKSKGAQVYMDFAREVIEDE